MIASLSKGSEDADKTVSGYVVAFFEATNFAESHPELAGAALFIFFATGGWASHLLAEG
ncbi:hypothetical protein TNCV_1410851, partial [Trichonephila clavipes]